MNIEASEVIVWQQHSEETHHVNQSDLFLRKLGFLDNIFSKNNSFILSLQQPCSTNIFKMRQFFLILIIAVPSRGWWFEGSFWAGINTYKLTLFFAHSFWLKYFVANAQMDFSKFNNLTSGFWNTQRNDIKSSNL